MTNMKRVLVILLTCIVMFCSLDIRGFAVDASFFSETRSFVYHSNLSKERHALDANTLKGWSDVNNSGTTAYSLMRESMVKDITATFSEIERRAQTVTDKTNAVFFMRVFSEAQCDYVNALLGSTEGAKFKEFITSTSEDYTNYVQGHALFLLNWGAFVNFYLYPAEDTITEALNKGNIYLNFALDDAIYTIDLTGSTTFSIDGVMLDNSQVIRCAWYEAFAKYTFNLYSFKTDEGAFNTLTEMSSSLGNLKASDAYLDAFVHPMLGIVPCVYDANSDIASYAVRNLSHTLGSDYYIRSMAAFVRIFYDYTEDCAPSVALERKQLGSMNTTEVFTREDEDSNFGGVDLAREAFIQHYVRLLQYPFLFNADFFSNIPSVNTFSSTVDNSMWSSVWCPPDYITFWGNTWTTDFAQRYGYAAVTLKDVGALSLIQPYVIASGGMTDKIEAISFFKVMIPIAYMYEWNDTNLYGVFSYEDTISTEATQGLTNLGTFVLRDGHRVFDLDTVEAYIYELESRVATGSLSFYEKAVYTAYKEIFNDANAERSVHLKYVYGSNKGKIYEASKAGLVAQPDADGNMLETNVVTVASKFDVPIYYSLVDACCYSGKLSQTITYDLHGIDWKGNQDPTEDELLNETWFPSLNCSIYTAGYLCEYTKYTELGRITPETMSIRLETSILPIDRANYTEVDFEKFLSGATDASLKLRYDQLLIESYQKHLILVPNTYNECVQDVWQFSEVSSEAESELVDVDVVFYVETGRTIHYDLSDVNSLDLATPNQKVRYATTVQGNANGLYYNTTGRLSLYDPTALKQNVVFLPHGVAMQLGSDYISDSGLLDWLQTSDAAAFINANTEVTGYTASTLYKRMLSKGASLKNQVGADELSALGDIADELANKNANTVYTALFNVFGLLGLLVMLYGIVLVLAYFLDLTNTFTETRILNKVTFGGLTAVHNKEELTEMGVKGDERRRYVTRNGILVRWIVCTLIGMLLITSNNIFIYILAFYETIVSKF